MTDEYDDIPPFLDRRANGRRRAYWMAYSSCPGDRNPGEWAMANYKKFLKRAKAVDEREGADTRWTVPAPSEPARPIRKRTRAPAP